MPAAVVAAHPDDETLAAADFMMHAHQLILIHLTDGAPNDMSDAKRAGFSSRKAYAAARAAELRQALEVMQVRPARKLDYAVADQELAFQLAPLAERLTSDLAGVANVITHPYEGGHPDHDAAAFVVYAACRLLSRSGRSAPRQLEFASYHLHCGERAVGRFWPDAEHQELAIVLDDAKLQRKRAAVRCFASQATVTSWFPLDIERYRTAPAYGFMEPPPPGEALYDRFGWRLSSPVWRGLAREALTALGLKDEPPWD